MNKLVTILTLLFTLFGLNIITAQSINQPGSGNALNYNGGDWIKITPGNLYQTQPLTIECWIKKSTSATGTVIDYVDNVGHYGWGLQAGAGVFFQIWNSIGVPIASISSTISINDNTWHHIAVSDDGTLLRLYIDGILDSTSASATHQYTSGMRTYLGMLRPEFNSLWSYSGEMDEIRIWNRALTQTEIQQYMCQKLPDCADPSLVGYWRMDEGTDNTCSGGQDVCDASCNGNHGTKF